MIKCAVCGSENEAAALFCGTCGSPLTPADTKAIAEDATAKVEAEATTPDEAVVPGKGGARRDLGIGDGTKPVEIPKGGGVDTEAVITDSDLAPSGPTVVCSVCGTVNDAARTYCRKCANELKPAAAPPPPPPPPPARRGLSPITIGLGAAAAVVALALVAVILFGGNGLPTTSASPSAPTTAGPSQSASVEPTTPGETTTPSPTAKTFTEGDTPEGQIAFARCVAGGGSCAIFLRPADASEKATRIIGATSGSATDPAISHDGTRIIYSVSGGLNIVEISTRTFEQHSNVGGDINAAWSWDNSQITFAGHRSADENPDEDLEVRLDGITVGGSSVPLTTNDERDHDPVFTPDDASIIWVAGEGDDTELKRIDIESRDVTDLTNDEFADDDPAISPDGTQLAFASKRESGDEFDIFLMDLTTNEITRLTTMDGNEHDPSWSPGGRYLVFAGGAEGQKDLFILDLKDMQISTFTTTKADSDTHPFWQ